MNVLGTPWALQTLLEVAIHGVAVPHSPTEEGLLSFRVTQPPDFGKDGDGEEGVG